MQQMQIVYDFTFKQKHEKYCYAPVTGRNNPYIVRKTLPIVDPVPNHPIPWRMSELEELAYQRMLHPPMAWTPSAAELVELERINERNEKIRKARSNVSRGRYIPPRPSINMLSSRPSGVPAVFRRDDSKAVATDYDDDDEYNPADQQFSSSQAMAMDAHVRITLEQRVQETTITDSNVDDIFLEKIGLI